MVVGLRFSQIGSQFRTDTHNVGHENKIFTRRLHLQGEGFLSIREGILSFKSLDSDWSVVRVLQISVAAFYLVSVVGREDSHHMAVGTGLAFRN